MSLKNFNNSTKKILRITFLLIFILYYNNVYCQNSLKEFLKGITSNQTKKQVEQAAEICRKFAGYVSNLFEDVIKSGKLKKYQVFDRFYIPVSISKYKEILGSKFSRKYYSFPSQFTTSYTNFLEEKLLSYQKKLVAQYGFVYLVISDYNGYVPTHNKNEPLTGDLRKDLKNHRSRRIYSDVVGLRASRNTKIKVLLQYYSRDTSEKIIDISSPIYILGKHWGCVRIGFKIN